jgi:hypothetical protein
VVHLLGKEAEAAEAEAVPLIFVGWPTFSYPPSIAVSCCEIEYKSNTNIIRMVEYT